MTAADVTSQVTPEGSASGSSFYAAMRILPREQREAMFEIYSFCRQVDDIADSDGPRPERLAALDRKLELIARTERTLVDLISTKHSLRVEWYIVILIVIEIGLSLYQLFGVRGRQ